MFINGHYYLDEVVNESYIEEDIINEDATAVAGLLLLTAIFGQEVVSKINKIKDEKKYSYKVFDKETNKIPNYGYENEKIALSYYAYYNLGIKNAEKNTLLYNSKSTLNKNVYLYKFNKSDIKLVYDEPFDQLCEKYNIKIKPMNESKLKDRDKVYKQTLSLVKQELNKYKELKSKARLEPDDKEYYDKFINGIDDSISILYCDIWDIVPNARSNDDKDVEHANKIAYEPIQNIIKVVNTKLPKDYKVDSYGDWDDLDISLTYTGKLNESYTPYNKGGVKMNTINNLAKIARQYGITESGNLRDDIVSEYTDIIESLNTVDESVISNDISLLPVYKIEEGYAIDLESIKFVIESKEMTLESAIQEIRDVNYIDDTVPMYCVLPSNINEQVTLESFINLNKILNEAKIIPACTREINETEFISEAFQISKLIDKYKKNFNSASAEKLQKTIDKCNENNKKLREEISKIDKMSEEEAKKYVKKESIKNIGKVTGLYTMAGGGGAASGALFVLNPALGITMLIGTNFAISFVGSNMGSKGSNNIEFTPAKYKQAIKNTISINNSTIASCKVSLNTKK